MALPGNPADGFVAPKWDPLYQAHPLPRDELIPLCQRAVLGRCRVQGPARASAHRDLLWSMLCCVGEVLIIACNPSWGNSLLGVRCKIWLLLITYKDFWSFLAKQNISFWLEQYGIWGKPGDERSSKRSLWNHTGAELQVVVSQELVLQLTGLFMERVWLELPWQWETPKKDLWNVKSASSQEVKPNPALWLFLWVSAFHHSLAKRRICSSDFEDLGKQVWNVNYDGKDSCWKELAVEGCWKLCKYCVQLLLTVLHINTWSPVIVMERWGWLCSEWMQYSTHSVWPTGSKDWNFRL